MIFSSAPPQHSRVRRPLMGVVLCFIPGVVVGLYLPLPPLCLTALSAFLLLGAVILIRRSFTPVLMGCAWFCCAWALASMAAGNPSPRSLHALMSHDREYIELIGVVSEEPTMSGRRAGFSVRVEGVRRIEDWQRASGEVWVEMSTSAAQDVHYGDRCSWDGLLQERQGRRVRHFRPYVFRAERGSCRRLASDCGNPLLAWCLRGRQRCARILSIGLDRYPRHVGLLNALLLGYRHALPLSLREVFATTGTLHIFAISGLHVGVAACLIIYLLKTFGISRHHWILLLAPLLLIYTLSTGMKVSAVRACVMALIYWSAPLFRRRPDGCSSLALAALLILLWSPLQLVDPGFILSFVVVSGIMMLHPPLLRLTKGCWRTDPWRLEAEVWWKRWPRLFAARSHELLMVSVAAWLASAPLTAYYFNLFSPVALVGNLLVVPGAFLVVFTGCLSLVTGSSFPLLAEMFNQANRVFISLLLGAVDGIKSVPFGHVYVRSPAWIWMLCWYAVLIALVLPVRVYRRCVVVLLICALGWGGLRVLRDESVQIDVVDAWSGSAAFVDMPGIDDILVDCGPSCCSYKLLRHLRSCGVDHLGAIVLTHADADHVGGALDVIHSVAVDEIWCPSYSGRSSVFGDLIKEAESLDIPVRYLSSGDAGEWADGVEWEVFHPVAGERYRRADDGSLVLRVARGSVAVLFTGGAGGRVEKELCAKACDPACTILVPGGHRGRRLCTDAWLDVLEPSVAVVGSSTFSETRENVRGWRQRFVERNISLWELGQLGGVRIQWQTRRQAPGEFKAFALLPLGY